MTLQETLTYLIVASAAFYTAYQFVMVFVVEKKQSGGCCGCDGNCSVKEPKQFSISTNNIKPQM